MTKKIGILKLGDYPGRSPLREGDYEDWIAAGMGLSPAEVAVFDPRRGDAFLPPEALRGLVITGSASMVSDREPSTFESIDYLRGALETGLPLFGICFGHQLLAEALGGEVGKNPKGREIGTVVVSLTEAAASDPLFAGLPSPLPVLSTHSETVLRLPEGAVVLARGEGDAHQALRLRERVWSVQFHPEMQAEEIRAVVRACAEPIRAEGLDPEALAKGTRETPQAATLLARFAALARA